MMKFFGGTVAKSAALYAGLFLGSFSLAEALTGFLWGALSDKIGRKPVLLLGCAGAALSMLIIGFSTNIYMAILGRAFGGGLNGNIGVVQTMVGELVTNPKHERLFNPLTPRELTADFVSSPSVHNHANILHNWMHDRTGNWWLSSETARVDAKYFGENIFVPKVPILAPKSRLHCNAISNNGTCSDTPRRNASQDTRTSKETFVG
jgi:hypothetical protein